MLYVHINCDRETIGTHKELEEKDDKSWLMECSRSSQQAPLEHRMKSWRADSNHFKAYSVEKGEKTIDNHLT